MSLKELVAQSVPGNDWPGWSWGGLSPASRGSTAGHQRSPVCVNELNALTVSSVYACIDRISNPLSWVPVEVLQRTPSGRVTHPGHAVARLFNRRANPFMTGLVMRKTGSVHMLGWGNGYIEIVRDSQSRPVELWPLLPWSTHMARSDSRLVARTAIDSQSFEIPDADILHPMGMTLDGYIGLSPIQQAAAAVGIQLGAETYAANFYSNDAQAGGVLTHPGRIGPEGVKNLRDGFTREQGGLKNAHRIKVLEEGVKFQQTTIPQDAAQFLGTREYQLAEICRMYNVPLHMVQSGEGSTVWGSGIEQLDLGFVRHTLSTWVSAWESEINIKLFTEREQDQGYYVRFNFDELLRGDSAARASYYTAALNQETGWLQRNEVRELEDYEPLARFDRVREQTDV